MAAKKSGGKKKAAKSTTAKKVSKVTKSVPKRAHKAAETMMAAGQALQTAAVVVESITTKLESTKKSKKK